MGKLLNFASQRGALTSICVDTVVLNLNSEFQPNANFARLPCLVCVVGRVIVGVRLHSFPPYFEDERLKRSPSIPGFR